MVDAPAQQQEQTQQNPPDASGTFNSVSPAGSFNIADRINALGRTVDQMKRKSPNAAKDIDEAIKPLLKQGFDEQTLAKDGEAVTNSLKEIVKKNKELETFNSDLDTMGKDFGAFAKNPMAFKKGYEGTKENANGSLTFADGSTSGMASGFGGGVFGGIIGWIVNFCKSLFGGFSSLLGEDTDSQNNPEGQKLKEDAKEVLGANAETVARRARMQAGQDANVSVVLEKPLTNAARETGQHGDDRGHGHTHGGVDYVPASSGENIKAAAGGRVVTVGNDPKGFGNFVVLDHGNNIYTVYGHIKDGSTPLKEGQVVAAGETLGATGNTGRSTGEHLHFGVMIGDKYIDPDKAYGKNLADSSVQKEMLAQGAVDALVYNTRIEPYLASYGSYSEQTTQVASAETTQEPTKPKAPTPV